MSKTTEIEKWTEHFRAFGAHDPERWARSQVEENIPQYSRYIFLQQAWQNIISDGDIAWMNSEIESAEKHPRGPGGGIGPALKRLLAAGTSREDIAEVVRVMQWRVLARIAYQLSDPGVVEYPNNSMPRVKWALVAVDADGQILHAIDSLHESVLDTDPSGREMRPKGVTRKG